jgi:hypothetical protein
MRRTRSQENLGKVHAHFAISLVVIGSGGFWNLRVKKHWFLVVHDVHGLINRGD